MASITSAGVTVSRKQGLEMIPGNCLNGAGQVGDIHSARKNTKGVALPPFISTLLTLTSQSGADECDARHMSFVPGFYRAYRVSLKQV